VVHAPVSLQVERAVRRGGLTEDEARARIAAQLPAEQKRQAGDFVIDNDLDVETLVRRADDVLDAICLSHGIDPGRYPRPA
jgi:dephospho-CoA kinase